MTPFLTVDQVAALLERDAQTVRAQLRSGKLAGTKHGRDWLVTPDAVEAYRRDHLGQPGRKAVAS